MIATVTTATTATLNTATAGSLALIVTLGLILLLIQREVLAGLSPLWAQRLRSTLQVAIVPLSVVFAASVAMRLALLFS